MDYWIYLAIMALSTYFIRAVPFALIEKKVKNTFVRSFLYYIPYAVLTAMTFPAALLAVGNIWAAAAGFGAAVMVALKDRSLTVVALAACSTVFVADWLMTLV